MKRGVKGRALKQPSYYVSRANPSFCHVSGLNEAFTPITFLAALTTVRHSPETLFLYTRHILS